MLGFLLTSHALSKVIETPGSFSDQVQAKLELTFSSVENYDSIVIFPTPEKFTVNKQTLKRIYYNPETLVIESDNNVLDYSLIRLKKGYCTTLDFILNKYENESVPISFNAYDYKSKHICIVFANSHETKSVVYGNNDKLSGKIYAYDNYILDGTSYRELKKNTDLELTYTTFMIDYITENISFNSFGINKGKKETYLDRYYIIDFETVLRGYLVLPEIKDFKYGMYDINVNGSYALVVSARSYMFILKYENYSIDAFSGTYQHKVPYNVNHDIVA
ncbi:hypothetical protein TVAG_283570 [Trichomonas vaginalis G3]|uniref:Uncharacterized protein n=1 Tax=Trichomonas vaginalis (strain ATCC PRA-98 / G3) TaxID=412133 RepID=A2DER1_TRIV3|nr:hypothetical protein TVAGG3_0576980 [Trichomonas vaginalis G3]EAY21188.1 hypothetical protein TVAG_283570 [Trichomonas vaginalis G3]KAI5522281.1 hypothetical protein TVAGG3_0576980 [Trichomonas vaginalis G3]|eukprot:XP_001582174.1 hypothetical protein [Trichomonas vaginalis G3]